MRPVELNPGAQYDFVLNQARHSAYMGGRGAGKTFASIARGLTFANQPKVAGQLPPIGCLLAVSFPQLKTIVYPALYLMLEMAGMKEGKDWKEVKNQSDRKFVLLRNGAEILMRSLDDPNSARGPNLSWFGIDEGRMFDNDEAYKILLATLRQGTHPNEEINQQGLWVPGENYRHAGWVTSTPNGFDWMWRRFHPESPHRSKNTLWFNAPTHENARHLPAEFIRDLETDYEGLFYRQEVLGEFVGAVHGAVWPMYDPRKHVEICPYDPELPLYAGWDFGIGDASVCLFAQVQIGTKTLYDGTIVEVPQLRIIGCIELTGKTVREFADEWWRYVDEKFRGRVPVAQWGDPAGLSRQQVSGTSTIAAFGEHGIYIRPTRKAPVDEGVIIIQNLMERPDGFLIDIGLTETQKAIQTYHFKVDDLGNKLRRDPVHDWTSHRCSALRYLAMGAIGLRPRRSQPNQPAPERGTWGFALEQALNDEEDELVMNTKSKTPLIWHMDEEVGLEGLLD